MNQDLLIVDLERVLLESDAGKAAASSMSALLSRARKERERLEEATKEARGAKKKALRLEIRALERDTKRQIRKRRQAVRDALLARVESVAESIRREQGAQLVLQRGAILAHADGLDVTEEVIRLMNAGSGRPALSESREKKKTKRRP